MAEPKRNNYRNKRQDEDIKEIRTYLKRLNDEQGDMKLEMANMRTDVATKFGEIMIEFTKVKVSKTETVYKILVPILMLMLGALLAWALTKL